MAAEPSVVNFCVKRCGLLYPTDFCCQGDYAESHKQLCIIHRLNIRLTDREGDKLAVKFSENARIDPDKLIALVSSGSASFTPSGVLKIRLTAEDDAAVFAEVRDLLNRLR